MYLCSSIYVRECEPNITYNNKWHSHQIIHSFGWEPTLVMNGNSSQSFDLFCNDWPIYGPKPKCVIKGGEHPMMSMNVRYECMGNTYNIWSICGIPAINAIIGLTGMSAIIMIIYHKWNSLANAITELV